MTSRYIFWHQKIVINKPISDNNDKIVTKQHVFFYKTQTSCMSLRKTFHQDFYENSEMKFQI